jgi:hypothetical protein
MDAHRHQWDTALLVWRDQDLALFARRAHAQLGRGFVLVERNEPRPVYITQVAGAPSQIVDAVCAYNPDKEALLVFEDEDPDSVRMSLVKIQMAH